MANENKCPICGKPTSNFYGKYREDGLCREHKDMLKDGLIYQCEKCGKWNKVYDICECEKEKTFVKKETFFSSKKKTEENIQVEEEPNKVVIINESNKSKCITCGKTVDGLLFCTNCYHKYKNKELYFKISNCTNIELVDENYEGRKICKDGHIVKSKSEREIDNYLFDHGIPHAYEKKLSYGPKEDEYLHPDFYLPHYLGKDKHVYIEHWGYNENNIKYTQTKKFKLPIYEKLGITLICTSEKTDMEDPESTLDRKLNKNNIEENKINFDT